MEWAMAVPSPTFLWAGLADPPGAERLGTILEPSGGPYPRGHDRL